MEEMIMVTRRSVDAIHIPIGYIPTYFQFIKLARQFSFEERIRKYYKDKDRILQVMNEDPAFKMNVIEDIVKKIVGIIDNPTPTQLAKNALTSSLSIFKKKKLFKVIEDLLSKIFDLDLGWYVVDYEDLKQTCAFIGGSVDYFDRNDHDLIYIYVIQSLKKGPIRERCRRLGLMHFAQEKLLDIKDEYIFFRIPL